MIGRMKDKVILVTGAARGQGAAHARLLALEGARVILSDLREAEGEAAASAIGGGASFVRHDVGSETSWRETLGAVETRYGRLDGLVNNAGIAVMAGLFETDVELFERTVRVNQFGVYLGMKYGAALMRRGGGGSIVNVSSIAGLRPNPRFFAYAGTKWAVRALSKAAALELAADKIRVNTIFPGIIDTPMLTEAVPGLDVAAFGAAETPLGRVGAPLDVATAVLFLLSDDAIFITGAELAVDGGLTA